MKRWFVTAIVPVFVAVALTVVITLGISHNQMVNADRVSAVNACLAVNRTHTGIDKLVHQLRIQTASQHLPKATTQQYEAFYVRLLADFPKLDCNSDPINLTG